MLGGYDGEKNPTPYKLTFILKSNQKLQVMDSKADYKMLNKSKKG